MAEFLKGTEIDFVKEMNKKVKSLGLKNTQFKNCTGLDEEGHYSTAYDMAIIAKELLKQANEAIVQAHQVQTDALQAESRGEELEYSILFSHAQDTCMCASSELNVAMHLVDLFEVIDKRFKKLENK